MAPGTVFYCWKPADCLKVQVGSPAPASPLHSSKVRLPAGIRLKKTLTIRESGLRIQRRDWVALWANPPSLRHPRNTSRADFQTPTRESGASCRRRLEGLYHRSHSKARAPFSVIPEMAPADSREMRGCRQQSWLEAADWKTARRRGTLELPIAEGFYFRLDCLLAFLPHLCMYV